MKRNYKFVTSAKMELSKLFDVGLVFFIASVLIQSCTGDEQAQTNDNKIETMIEELTLEEKVGLIVGDGRFLINAQNEKIADVFIANRNSKMIIPRLNIRTTALTDGPSGINKHAPLEGVSDYTYTTSFPTSTCLAASWNTKLAEEVGKTFGKELLEYDYDLVLMPALNLHRNPKCGRNFEYYSEDPLLSGKMAAAMVRGLQSNGVGATLKHFVANNQESNRRKYNAVISQRALREIYLRGFEIAVREGRPKAIMTSYNKLNGFYTAEIPEMLQDVVRKEWGFDGLYMTDFDMRYGDPVAQVRAGINLIMSGNEQELAAITRALNDKTLDESTLDRNLYYNLNLKLGSPSMLGHEPSFKPDLVAHADMARKAVGEGIVLLKNESNTLPINDRPTVAVFGKISYHTIITGTGSGSVRSNKYAVSVNDGLKTAGFRILGDLETNYTDYIEKIKRENLVPPYFDNPKMRKDNNIIGNQAPPHFKKRLVAFSKEQPMGIAEIKKYESGSDLALITLGRSGGENYENGYLPITQVELDLVKNVCEVFHAAAKKVVVVLNVGGVWETASWRDYPDAIVLAWQPGQEGGHAVADILTGAVNPSGKLPDSFPLKYEDVPSASSFPGIPKEEPVNSFYTDGIYVGYRYYDSFDVPTAYEFGYGLSYTTFEFEQLELSAKEFSSEITATVTVNNTGEVAGKEVVQLYLYAPAAELEKPVQELKAFAKTRLLKPGESQQLSLKLDIRDLASFRTGISAWVADEGKYEVRVGASSKDIRLRDSFNLSESIVVEKVHDVLYPNHVLNEISRND
jgi:beta-glucosidase